MKTNQFGNYGLMNVWYIPDGITNIFSMNNLEKKYSITYDSWQGYYVVHTANGEVGFHKDKIGLPQINFEESCKEAAALPVQTGSEEAVNAFMQTVRQNYEGYKREILEAKEARRAVGMIGNPSKRDFKGMVQERTINNCPVTTNAISNAHTMSGPDLANVRGEDGALDNGTSCWGFRVSTKVDSRAQQDNNTGSRRIFCQWYSVFIDCVEADQVHYGGTGCYLYS